MLELFKINDLEDKKYINRAFISSRVVFVLIFIACLFIFKRNALNWIYNFDSEHYINIAQNGYQDAKEYAFFPFFPIVCRLLLNIFIHPISIVIFNTLISYFVGVGIYNLSREFYSKNKNINRASAIMWFFSPIAIYTSVPYSESLFCILSILVLYLYKKRKNFVLNGILLGLLVSTRSTGCLMFFTLFAILFVELITSKERLTFKNRFLNILKMYIPATIISCLYPIFLHFKLGNWKYFVDVQYEYWWKIKSNIFTVILRELDILISGVFASYNPVLKIEFILQSSFALISLIICILAIIHVVKRKEFFKKKELLIYLIATLYICYSVARNWASPSTSYFRYLFAIISLYLIFDDEKIIKTITRIGLFMNICATFGYFLFRFLY